MQEENKSKGGVYATVAIIIVALVAVGYFVMGKKPADVVPAGAPNTDGSLQTASAMESGQTASSGYKDGTYSVLGNYVSPGGPEEISVSLTLKDGIVTEADVVSKAERPISKQMQGNFITGYKALVVGKNIDEINLTKVSGSSLTPKGFNDAVTKIKTEAKA